MQRELAARERRLFVVAAALSCALACRTDPPACGSGLPQSRSQSPVLVRVDGRNVTVDDAQADLDHLPARLRSTYGTAAEQRREFLQKVIDTEILAAKAKALGYDDDPEIVATFKRAMARKYFEARTATPKSEQEIDRHTVETFYRDNPEMFRAPERVRITEIIVSDERRAKEVWQLAKAAADRHRGDPAADLAAFKALVQKHSIDEASKSSGGDQTVVMGSAGDPLRPFAAAVFALERSGEVMAPFDVGGHFHVVKLRERVAAGLRPLDEELRSRIERKLAEKRTGADREQVLAELRRGVKVEVFDEHLNKLRFDSGTPGPQMASTEP